MMPDRTNTTMPAALLAAAFFAGTALVALPPLATRAGAEEHQGMHHGQMTDDQAQSETGEHKGHSGMKGGGMMGGGMMGGGMMGGMHEEGMRGCKMMGGEHAGMKGDHAGMKHDDMRKMMHEMMIKMTSRIDERLAELKSELGITDAQLPQWTAFADTLRSASKSMERMHKEMMADAAEHMPKPAAAPEPVIGDTDYPDKQAVKKVDGPAPQAKPSKSLPEKLAALEKRLSEHLANLKAIAAALDPLYATFDEKQKKTADGLKIGPMGVM